MNFDIERMQAAICEILNTGSGSRGQDSMQFCNIAILKNSKLFHNSLSDICGTNYQSELKMECNILCHSFDNEMGRLFAEEFSGGSSTVKSTIIRANEYMLSVLGITSAWRYYTIQVFSHVFGWNNFLNTSDLLKEDEKLFNEVKGFLATEHLSFSMAKMLSHLIATDGRDVVMLTQDGNVLSTKKIRNRKKWTDLIQVSAGEGHFVGLKSDGTVVDSSDSLQEKIKDWNNIISVEAGANCIIGLKKDGSVIAEGKKTGGKCNTGSWKNIIDISAKEDLTIGRNQQGEIFIANNKNIASPIIIPKAMEVIKIFSGGNYVIALYSDKSLFCHRIEGGAFRGQSQVSSFNDIVVLSSNLFHTVGVTSDGNCLLSPYIASDSYEKEYDYGKLPQNWNNLLTASTSNGFVVGLKKDGTVVCHGAFEEEKKRIIESWSLFSDLEKYIEKYNR